MNSTGGELTFDGGVIGVNEIVWRFDPTPGKGGQRANRAHTRAHGSINLTSAGRIKPRVRDRLIRRLGHTLSVTAGDSRQQSRNRQIVVERMQRQLRDAARPTPRRVATRPSARATRRRLTSKRQRGQLKALRQSSHSDY